MTQSEQDEVARLAGRRRDVLRDVAEPADGADDRGRPDVGAVRRVVQRHVAGDDRNAERIACRRDPFDGPSELPGALWPLGVADVETVGDRKRRRADAHEIAGRLSDRSGRADEWIDRREARLRVDRDRDPIGATFDAHDRRVGTRTHHGVRADHLVVGAVDRSPRRDRRRR